MFLTLVDFLQLKNECQALIIQFPITKNYFEEYISSNNTSQSIISFMQKSFYSNQQVVTIFTEEILLWLLAKNHISLACWLLHGITYSDKKLNLSLTVHSLNFSELKSELQTLEQQFPFFADFLQEFTHSEYWPVRFIKSVLSLMPFIKTKDDDVSLDWARNLLIAADKYQTHINFHQGIHENVLKWAVEKKHINLLKWFAYILSKRTYNPLMILDFNKLYSEFKQLNFKHGEKNYFTRFQHILANPDCAFDLLEILMKNIKENRDDQEFQIFNEGVFHTALENKYHSIVRYLLMSHTNYLHIEKKINLQSSNIDKSSLEKAPLPENMNETKIEDAQIYKSFKQNKYNQKWWEKLTINEIIAVINNLNFCYTFDFRDDNNDELFEWIYSRYNQFFSKGGKTNLFKRIYYIKKQNHIKNLITYTEKYEINQIITSKDEIFYYFVENFNNLDPQDKFFDFFCEKHDDLLSLILSKDYFNLSAKCISPEKIAYLCETRNNGFDFGQFDIFSIFKITYESGNLLLCDLFWDRFFNENDKNEFLINTHFLNYHIFNGPNHSAAEWFIKKCSLFNREVIINRLPYYMLVVFCDCKIFDMIEKYLPEFKWYLHPEFIRAFVEKGAENLMFFNYTLCRFNEDPMEKIKFFAEYKDRMLVSFLYEDNDHAVIKLLLEICTSLNLPWPAINGNTFAEILSSKFDMENFIAVLKYYPAKTVTEEMIFMAINYYHQFYKNNDNIDPETEHYIFLRDLLKIYCHNHNKNSYSLFKREELNNPLIKKLCNAINGTLKKPVKQEKLKL